MRGYKVVATKTRPDGTIRRRVIRRVADGDAAGRIRARWEQLYARKGCDIRVKVEEA